MRHAFCASVPPAQKNAAMIPRLRRGARSLILLNGSASDAEDDPGLSQAHLPQRRAGHAPPLAATDAPSASPLSRSLPGRANGRLAACDSREARSAARLASRRSRWPSLSAVRATPTVLACGHVELLNGANARDGWREAD